MYAEKFLKLYSRWHHRKSGGYYIVIGVARCSTNGPGEGKHSVVYWSEQYQHLNHRDIDEFLDGRFVPLDDKGQPIV